MDAFSGSGVLTFYLPEVSMIILVGSSISKQIKLQLLGGCQNVSPVVTLTVLNHTDTGQLKEL